jgi:hypothetical protein
MHNIHVPFLASIDVLHAIEAVMVVVFVATSGAVAAARHST